MRTRTSKAFAELKDWMIGWGDAPPEGYGSLIIPFEPVPASRPRVSKWGTYYGKHYTRWRKEVGAYLNKLEADRWFDPCVVAIEFVCTPAKTTKRHWPRGDVDNYAKAVLDAITTAGVAWHDDDQVLLLSIAKRYADPGEPGGIYVHYGRITEEPNE